MAKLLIVDDDPDKVRDLRALAAISRFSDQEVVWATSREGAEARLAEPFDLAVIDIALRGDLDEEGVDLIRALHTRQPRCGIIALTTHKPEAQERALQAGATYFINARSQRGWLASVREKVDTLRRILEKRSSSD